MHNFEDFLIPNDGEISVCEIDGRVQNQNIEFINVSAFTSRLDKHPKIQLSRSLLHPTTSGDEGRALFLPVHTPFLKQLTQVYYEHGLFEAIHTASEYHNKIVSNTSKLILKLIDIANRARLIFNPALKYSGPSLIEEISTTRNWLNHTIRALSWHPHYTKIAVATCDDSVRIYNEDQTHIPLLKCKEQKNITCLAWRPLSASELAVGHENGIIVWNVDPNTLVTRPSVSNATILYRIHHKPVISICWDLGGDYLVSAAACDSNIIIWDVEMNHTSYLKGSTFGNILVKLSPNGKKMFTASNSIVFRLWECNYWKNDRWTVLSGRVQTACWVNDGSDLLFATDTETVIYSLAGEKGLIFQGGSNSAEQAVPIFDVHRMELEGVLVGGIIQNMESDPDGRHLAVLFKDTNCIALFNIVPQLGTVQLIASALIMGLPAEVPCVIAFQQNFKNSACLTIGWSSGRIQYYPIIYTNN